MANNSHRSEYYHRGLAFWYNIGLATFLIVAMSLAAIIVSSGIGSSEVSKEVLFEALVETRQ